MIDAAKKPKTVLVGDELSDICEIADILKSDGISEILYVKSISEEIRIACEAIPDILICLFNPVLDYTEFFRSIKDNAGVSPPAVIFIFDKAEDSEIAMILELGADDFIEKSLCRQVLIPKARFLADIKNLREELKNEQRKVKEAKALLLKNFKNFKELTAILLKILEVRIPGTSDRAEKAKVIAEYLTEKLGIEEEKRRKIVFAAILRELGKVGLPDDIAGKDYKDLSAEALNVYKQYTTVGSMIISTMTGFRESADAVYHQLENYDGSGFPDGLMGDQIHVGAKILRAIALLEHLSHMSLSANETADHVRNVMNKVLDRKIANLVIEFVLDRGNKTDCGRIKISLDKLKTGMVIADDVYAASGIKLIPKGVKVQEKMIEVIMTRNSMDPVIGGIYIEC